MHTHQASPPDLSSPPPLLPSFIPLLMLLIALLDPGLPASHTRNHSQFSFLKAVCLRYICAGPEEEMQSGFNRGTCAWPWQAAAWQYGSPHYHLRLGRPGADGGLVRVERLAGMQAGGEVVVRSELRPGAAQSPGCLLCHLMLGRVLLQCR